MLVIMADFCLACSKEKKQLEKILLKEKLNEARHKLIIEAQGQPTEDCEESEQEFFTAYWDTVRFFKEMEINCFTCSGKDASIHRMIQEHFIEEIKSIQSAEEELAELEKKSGNELIRSKVISLEKALRKKKLKFTP